MSFLITLSPAKKMREIVDQTLLNNLATYYKQPIFFKQTQELITELKKFDHKKLQDLMKISPKIAELNYKRYQNFNNNPTEPAIFKFYGDAYQALAAESLTESEILRLEQQLCILSGLYGLLSPLTLISEYRLEMGRNLVINQCKNLYEFWQDHITKQIKQLMIDKNYIINLCSKEYWQVLNLDALTHTIIVPIFKNKTASGYKTLMHYAKRARGLMVRYIIQNNISNINDLENFSADGYKFIEKKSHSAKNIIEYLYVCDKVKEN